MNFDWENVCVLDREPTYRRRIISKMIHIQQQEKGLNRQEDTELLNKVYCPIFKKCMMRHLSQW